MREYAWAAGFFDGEGNVSYRPSDPIAKRRPRIFVQIAQVERQPLERWQALFGRKINGPYTPKTRASSPYHTWAVEGFKPTMALFNQLGPYLCEPKFKSFADAIERYYTWIENPLCHVGHGTAMTIGSNGKFFCHTCKSESGRKAANIRWHSKLGST